MIINKNLVEDKRNRLLQEEDKEVKTEDDIEVVTDVASASTTEIADAIKVGLSNELNINELDLDEDDEDKIEEDVIKVAKRLKTYADGFEEVDYAPLGCPNVLTFALDKCLSSSMWYKELHDTAGADLLVTGLPGSGKSAVVKDWAKRRGCNLWYLDCKDEEVGTIVRGFPMKDNTKPDQNIVTHGKSDSLNNLYRPRSILFLDEFNRASPTLRASLLTLINEHQVPNPNKRSGYTTFKNLLFTVACINPSVDTDIGAIELITAESNRFVLPVDYDSDPERALQYINFHIVEENLKDLIPSKATYAYSYRRLYRTLNLAAHLLGSPDFEFDNKDDLLDLQINKENLLSQRSIYDALYMWGKNKKEFIDYISGKTKVLGVKNSHNTAANFCKFSKKRKDMIINILSSYTDPLDADIVVPGTEEEIAQATDSLAKNGVPESGNSTDVFDVIEDDDELDKDLFSNAGVASNSAAKAAKIDPATAAAKLGAFHL